jgi:hypothetical protein
MAIAETIVVFPFLDAQSAALPTDTSSIQSVVAVEHLPVFIAAPGATDLLLVVMAFVLIGTVLAAGVFFFWLHSLPERLAHNSTKVHFDIVAVLGLLSLFTHIHLFWVAALLLALVKIPTFSLGEFSGILGRMALSLERMANAEQKSIRPSETNWPLPEQRSMTQKSRGLGK